MKKLPIVLNTAARPDAAMVTRELRESEAFFRQLFERHSAVMLLIDYQSHVIVDANPAAAQFYGYPLESLRGMNVSRINAQPEPEIHQQRQQAIIGERNRFVFDHRLANGVVRAVEVHISTVNYKGKSVFFSIIHDITERKQAEEALHRSETKFHTLFDSTSDAVMLLDENGFFDCNKATLAIFGCVTREEFCSKHPADLSPPLQPCGTDSLTLVNRRIATAMEQGNLKFEWVCQRADTGKVFPADVLLSSMELDGRTVLQATIRDIAERKQAENQLRVAAVTFETHDAILVTDANANIIRVNQAFQDITGYSQEDVLGKNPRILSAGRQDEAFYAAMWQQLLNTGSWSGEMWDQRKSGQIYPKWLAITAVKNDQGQTTEYVGIFSDITARKQAEKEIRNMAFYDALTKLPNRRLLNDRLSQAIASSKRSGCYGALMFIDLDNFKPLNDTHGHGVGDLLLMEVAHRLTSCVREVDTVARFGGDEFVVMLSELDEDKAESTAQADIVAEKIRSTLAEPYLLKIQQEGKAETTIEHHCTSSVGVVLFINHEASAEDILKWADIAMYQAKEAGRNLIRFYEPKA